MSMRCLMMLIAGLCVLGPINAALAQSDAEMNALQRDIAACNARCANVSRQDTARYQACASEKAALDARIQQINQKRAGDLRSEMMNEPPERQLAFLNDPNASRLDPLVVARFKSLLDQLAKKYSEDAGQIAN